MTPGQTLFTEVTGRDEQNWLDLSDVGRKSWEMRAGGALAFIPSPGHVNHREEVSTVRAMPEPEIPAHPVNLKDLPRGARIVANRFANNGWQVEMFACRGPWSRQTVKIELTEMDDDGNEIVTGEEKIKYAQADSVLVRASRGKQRAGAAWLLKPWVKDPEWEFLFAQVRPDIGKVNSKGLKAITEEVPQDD